MNFKKLLYLLAVLCTAFPLILPSLTLADDQAPPVVRQSSWGQVKVLYRGSAEQSQETPQTGVRKPGSTVAAAYSIRIKPYAVNEFWVDPNNPGSGRHVVMFFRLYTNACRYPAARLWKGYQRDWLNRWQLWVRYPAPNTEELMLFADGSFWWSHRLFNSAWGLAQQFELCF